MFVTKENSCQIVSRLFKVIDMSKILIFNLCSMFIEPRSRSYFYYRKRKTLLNFKLR